MKKFFIILLTFTIIGGSAFSETKRAKGTNSTKSSKRSSSSRRAGNSVVRTKRSASTSVGKSSTAKADGKTVSDFNSCMDNFCKPVIEGDEKGRCRCSSTLSRIEKVLRDIEKIQNEADAQNKHLETLMNVSNTSAVNDSIGNVYNNINSIERKAKTMAGKKVDVKTMVAEGYQLYKKSYDECKSYLSTDASVASKQEQEYQTMIETDCSAYTSILKEKADNAQNLLVQAKKNQEMYDEQKYKKLNQLDTSSCYVEYETCMKTQCGEDFRFCLEKSKLAVNLKKCESVNYGKCEENKSVVITDLKKAINKAIEKEKIAQSCRSALGQFKEGKCLFEVRYVLDKCGVFTKNCGDAQTKFFTPGYKVTCDDKRGDFKDLATGCHEACYLVGANNEERKIGTNVESDGGKNVGRTIGAIFSLGLSLISSDAQPGCKSNGDLDRYTLPVPAGWGTDGYPLDEELKNAF
ncbi:MAG: hypothetical protein K6F04_01095 [bacterium]|nr:hypothetical protein [bacterium]